MFLFIIRNFKAFQNLVSISLYGFYFTYGWTATECLEFGIQNLSVVINLVEQKKFDLQETSIILNSVQLPLEDVDWVESSKTVYKCLGLCYPVPGILAFKRLNMG